MDCEYGKGCSEKATKNLTATFAGSVGSTVNLCTKHVIKAQKDFESGQHPDDIVVVRTLS